MDATTDTPVLHLRDIERSKNVDALLTPAQSDAIGRDVVTAYDEDKASRKEWETRTENAIKLALQMVEAKSFPWPNASNVKFPLVTIAALQFSARAYPALVKVPDLVHYRVMGEDKDGQKAARASRIGRHMSYQLLDEDEAWEEDTDRKFIVVPIIGCAFKKTYWDAVKEANCSRLVLPQNLVVHYYTRSIEECERKTEVFELYDREIKERQLKGLYSTKELSLAQIPQGKLSDQRQGVQAPPQSKATPRTLLEQHAYFDLDGDGYPEPYVATVDLSSKKVLRIVARFAKVVTEQSVQVEALRKARVALDLEIARVMTAIQTATAEAVGDPEQLDPAAAQLVMQAAERHIAEQIGPLKARQAQIDAQVTQWQASDQAEPKVLQISALEHYTKYGFIPSPDGGFYDLGLGALLGPVNDSVNTLINQLTDSGTLQNGSGGFIGKGARIQGGELRFKPFEWKRVNVAGQTLRDSIVPLPVPQPSSVLFQLLSLLITYGEKISSVNEAMTGNNPGQNTPAYNMQAMLEQGLQVFNGIFKRLYRSFRKELRKLYVLNRVYLNPIEYYETLDGRFEALQYDYTGDEKDVVPAADPNAFSSMQNMMKAQFLASRAAASPGYNTAAVERRLLEAMDIPDPQEVFPLDDKGQPTIPAPRNPEIDLKVAEEQRRALEAKSRMEINAATADSRLALDEAQVYKIFADIQKDGSQVQIEKFNAITDRIKANAETIKKVADANKPKARSD
jgi:hypothetical protein